MKKIKWADGALEEIVNQIREWTKVSKKHSPEIYDSKGDITKLKGGISEDILLLGGEDKELKYLKQVKFLYDHFESKKEIYKKGFINNDEVLMNTYASGVWLIVTYVAAACVYVETEKGKSPDTKYGEMIQTITKQIKHPMYTEYMDNAEKRTFNAESLMFEGVIAAATAVVSFMLGIRLIQWNMYMIRTKLSDKLKVTAEYMEKNAKRIGNTDRKNKDKIVERQLKSVDMLNRVAEFLRIKLDDEPPVSKPPEIKKKKNDDTKSKADDDMDDIEL